MKSGITAVAEMLREQPSEVLGGMFSRACDMIKHSDAKERAMGALLKVQLLIEFARRGETDGTQEYPDAGRQ